MTVTSCASATFSTFPTISDQVYYVGDTASALTITAPTMSDSSCDSSLSYTMKLSSGVAIWRLLPSLSLIVQEFLLFQQQTLL